MKSKFSLLILGATLSAAMGSVMAQQAPAAQGNATAAASAAAMTSGEVRKVDPEQGKVTIKHEPIANLDMPAMTMVFRVAEPQMLKSLNVGDKIRFQAESTSGAIVVTQIQK